MRCYDFRGQVTVLALSSIGRRRESTLVRQHNSVYITYVTVQASIFRLTETFVTERGLSASAAVHARRRRAVRLYNDDNA